MTISYDGDVELVSTHSRLKAAGIRQLDAALPIFRFNTQPPEGGWPEPCHWLTISSVSTHSRLKAAGWGKKVFGGYIKFQHTAA